MHDINESLFKVYIMFFQVINPMKSKCSNQLYVLFFSLSSLKLDIRYHRERKEPLRTTIRSLNYSNCRKPSSLVRFRAGFSPLIVCTTFS